jgi:hypothetical protein
MSSPEDIIKEHENQTQVNEKAWDFVKPLVLKGIIGSVIGAALVAVFAIIVGEFGTMQLQLLLTIVLIIVFTLFSWYDADVSAKRSHTFALVSVGVSVYLLIAGMGKIWFVHEPTYEGYNPDYYSATNDVYMAFSSWIVLVIVARIALLHAHLLLNIHRRYPTPLLQLVAKCTMGLIALLTFLISLPILTPEVEYSEAYWRLLGAVVVLDILGTILIPLSHALFHHADKPQGPTPEQLARQRQAAQGSQQLMNAQPQAQGYPYTPQDNRVNGFNPPQLQQIQPPKRVEKTFQAPVPFAKPAPKSLYSAPPANAQKANVEPEPLPWPRYDDGTPLPYLPDGSPDFSQVQR